MVISDKLSNSCKLARKISGAIEPAIPVDASRLMGRISISANIYRTCVIVAPSTAIACLMLECSGWAATPPTAAEKLAIPILQAEETRKTDDAAGWKEVWERLAKLYGNSTKEADEAVTILMSFYLGEDNGEELFENLLSRGPRMIPLINRYLREEPASLLVQYPKRMRLERSTVTMFLSEALGKLKFQAGARRLGSASVETAPLRKEAGDCTVELVQRPKLKFPDGLVQPGEAYKGKPVLRVDIQESGDTANVQLLSSSGIKQLDTLLLANVAQWKYAPRHNCGVVTANVVVTVDWTN